MRSLPRIVRCYLWAVYVAGMAAIVFTGLWATFPTGERVWEAGLFLILAVLAGGQKIYLIKPKNDRDICSMSLGFVVTFAALMRFGPGIGVLAAMVSCLSASLYPKRLPLFQLAFNVMLGAVEAAGAGWVYLRMNGGMTLQPLHAFSVVTAACLVYYAVNTGGVAVIISLCTAQNPFKLWRQTFLWTAPNYFAGACIGTLALMLFGQHLETVLLFGTPLVYLTHQSYANYSARMQERDLRVQEKQQHIDALQHSQARLHDMHLATIKSLALAIDAKDQHTHQHILRVQRYAVAIARQMGLVDEELESVSTGSLLHDIGKLGVPENILLKPGPLTPDEFAQIKKHPQIGAAILAPVEFPGSVLAVVKSHHERWDGRGYPDGLRGEDIPLTARILAVADVFDALTSDRAYRTAWTQTQALEEIRRGRGVHFDPSVVDAFMHVVTQDYLNAGESVLEPTPSEPAAADSSAAQAVREIGRATSVPWTLYEIVQSLSESMGPEEIVQTLSAKLQTVFPGASNLFLLWDGDDALSVHTALGEGRDFFSVSRAQGGAGISVRAARSRQTYLGAFHPHDLRPDAETALSCPSFQTALIVPIVYEGESLGTINLYHPQPQAFSAEDRQLLEAIARRAAAALHRALLYDVTRSHAYTDSLTGLYNIRFLSQHVDERCRREDAEPFALLCLDLDSFKPINDNFGHQKGDQVLRDLGRLFCDSLRDSDIVARYGGDEFLVVLHGAGPAEAAAMARRLQDAVAGYQSGLIHDRLGELRLGVSIGWGCFPADGQDCSGLLAAADAQMYHDKVEHQLGRMTLQSADGRAKRRPAKRTSRLQAHGTEPVLVFRFAECRSLGEAGNDRRTARRKKCLAYTARAAR